MTECSRPNFCIVYKSGRSSDDGDDGGETDRCMALEGDKAYECWEALFKFEDIKVFVVHAYALQAPNFDCNDQCLKGVVVVCDSDSIFVMWLFCDEREREREK